MRTILKYLFFWNIFQCSSTICRSILRVYKKCFWKLASSFCKSFSASANDYY